MDNNSKKSFNFGKMLESYNKQMAYLGKGINRQKGGGGSGLFLTPRKETLKIHNHGIEQEAQFLIT